MLAAAWFMPLSVCLGKGHAEILKEHARNSISLELQFARKNPSTLERMITVLDPGPNGYATGFFVGKGLVITAYHVVSGELDVSKRRTLGFSKTEPLAVRIFTNGCQAKIVSVDKEADLALLQVCGVSKRDAAPSFQSTITKDEKILLIAKPHGEKVVGHGTLIGSYEFNGIEYWSIRIAARDGFRAARFTTSKAR